MASREQRHFGQKVDRLKSDFSDLRRRVKEEHIHDLLHAGDAKSLPDLLASLVTGLANLRDDVVSFQTRFDRHDLEIRDEMDRRVPLVKGRRPQAVSLDVLAGWASRLDDLDADERKRLQQEAEKLRTEQYDKSRSEAESILRGVLGLRLAPGASRDAEESLRKLAGDAGDLLAKLAAGDQALDTDLQSMIAPASRHALACVWRFARSGCTNLSEDEVDAGEAAIGAAYGTALAKAAVRGRLQVATSIALDPIANLPAPLLAPIPKQDFVPNGSLPTPPQAAAETVPAPAPHVAPEPEAGEGGKPAAEQAPAVPADTESHPGDDLAPPPGAPFGGDTAASVEDIEDEPQHNALAGSGNLPGNGADNLDLARRIASQYPGLACHVARLASEGGSWPDAAPPPEAFKALALARHIQMDAHGVLADEIRDLFQSESMLSWLDRPSIDVPLALAMVVVPTVHKYRETQAESLIKELRARLGSKETAGRKEMLALVDALVQLGGHHGPGRDGLRHGEDVVAWKDENAKIVGEIEAKVESGRANPMNAGYAPATKIRRNWADNGVTAELLRKIQAADVDAVRKLAKQIQTDKEVRDLIERANRDINGATSPKIVGNAANVIVREMYDYGDLAKRWLEHQSVKPEDLNGPSEKMKMVEQLLRAVHDVRARFGREEAFDVLLAHLDALQATPDQEVRDRHGDLQDAVLDGDLMRWPGAWMPKDDLNLEALRNLRAEHLLPWPDAVERVLQERRPDRVRLLGFAWRVAGATAQEIHDCEVRVQALEADIERDRLNLIDGLRDQYLQALELGCVVSPEEVDRFEKTLEALQQAPEIEFVKAKVDELARGLASLRREEVERRRLDVKKSEAAGKITTAQASELQGHLDKENLDEVVQVLDLVKSGERISPPDLARKPTVFDEFLTAEFQDAVVGGSWSEDLVAGRGVFKGMAPALRDDARRCVKAWEDLFRTRNQGAMAASQLAKNVAEILQWIGLRPSDPSAIALPVQASANGDFRVTCSQVSDRHVCALPQYGSGASGQYRVVVWPSKDMPDIGRVASSPGATVVILCVGRVLNKEERNRFAADAREHNVPVLLLDGALYAFLCRRAPGARLGAFFGCSTPFGWSEPYGTSTRPAELFFGRKKEMHSVASMEASGASFLYGGRRLGKTSLLREVASRHHDASKGRVVLWLDLRPFGFEGGVEPGQIWRHLSRALAPYGVMDKQVASADTFRERVIAWLDPSDQWTEKRILLLLDEADAWLEAEARSREVNLKGLQELQEKTNRRFKVVFAGLRNVSRRARSLGTENTPVAQFGQHVCIGPLFADGEWKAARDLIVEPFAAMGCIFESRLLPMQICGNAGFYPNLVQVICRRLQAMIRDHMDKVPFMITREHVKRVLRDGQVALDIQNAFAYTVNVDARYKALANIVLHYEYELRNPKRKGPALLLTGDFLRHEGQRWWPAGLPKDRETFESMLLEMKDMGILTTRESGEHRAEYRLRSRHLSTMLGTADQVDDYLLELHLKSPEPDYDPASSRFHPEEGRPVSPFTAAHAAKMMKKGAVTVVLGARVAGRDLVAKDIEGRVNVDGSSPEAFIHVKGDQTRADFDAALDDLLERGREQVQQAVLVVSSARWTCEWVKEAADRFRRVTAADRRVVFVGTPSDAFAWARYEKQGADLGVQVIRLGPWSKGFFERWCADFMTRFNRDPDAIGLVGESTGRWHGLVLAYEEVSSKTPDNDSVLLDWQGVRASELLSLFEIDAVPEDAQQVLEVVLEYGPVTADEIADVKGLEVDVVRGVLDVADRLRLVVPAAKREGRGQEHGARGGAEVPRWELDPVLKQLMQATRR